MIKQIIWKLKFAKHLQDLTKISFLYAYEIAGIHLENFGFDTEEQCPIDAASDEYMEWVSDSVFGEKK